MVMLWRSHGGGGHLAPIIAVLLNTELAAGRIYGRTSSVSMEEASAVS